MYFVNTSGNLHSRYKTLTYLLNFTNVIVVDVQLENEVRLEGLQLLNDENLLLRNTIQLALLLALDAQKSSRKDE